VSQADSAPRPLVALSTASVYPDRTPDAFEVAARLGYDGVEVMVTPDAVSQDVEVLRRLADYHSIPVLAVQGGGYVAAGFAMLIVLRAESAAAAAPAGARPTRVIEVPEGRI